MSVVYVDVDAGVVGESGSGTKKRTYQELQRLIWEGTPCDLVTLWKALSAPVPIRVGDLWTLPSSRLAHNGGKLNRYMCMCMCAAAAPARARENARTRERKTESIHRDSSLGTRPMPLWSWPSRPPRPSRHGSWCASSRLPVVQKHWLRDTIATCPLRLPVGVPRTDRCSRHPRMMEAGRGRVTTFTLA